MATQQKYGIKYPFTADNDLNMFIDTNDEYKEEIKSKVLHVLFTPKGQKIRDPEFGTELIKFLFEPADDATAERIKSSITNDINKQVPEVQFKDITVESVDNDGTSRVVIVHYIINGTGELTSVAVNI